MGIIQEVPVIQTGIVDVMSNDFFVGEYRAAAYARRLHSSLKFNFSECLHFDPGILFRNWQDHRKTVYPRMHPKSHFSEDLHITPRILFEIGQNHEQTIFPKMHSSLKSNFSECLHLDPTIFQNWQDHRKIIFPRTHLLKICPLLQRFFFKIGSQECIHP